MTDAPARAARWRQVTQHVAFRALLRSVAVNLLAPALIYRLATPHFHEGSLIPLALSSLPPMLALAYSLLKLRAVDFLGLFALEGVAVNLTALLLAHTEQAALVGRALQNGPLSLLFFGSLAFRRPMALFLARQLATGNEPGDAEAFDQVAVQPGPLRLYRLMTWIWGAALLLKSAGSVYLATTFAAKDYLIVSPLWDMVSDASLVTWCIVYGRARLRALSAEPAPATPMVAP